MAVRRVSIGGYVAEDTDTQGQRSTGIKRRTITFDEIRHTALSTAPEPFTSPLSCAWLAVVLISLLTIVIVILSLCYIFKKSRPPLPTSPPVILVTPDQCTNGTDVTVPSQGDSSHSGAVANISAVRSDRDDGTSSSRIT
ncbi:hypothetical protein MTO96_016974 [Rhipicephalus appendiculatus]